MPKRKKLSAATKLAADKSLTLDDLRFRRDLAQRDGDIKLAFTFAIAIDKKKKLYA